ncbi:hypothetical protein FRB94_007498 [Tulasnella sp. JGI-2019a]|nr:hypothetical protein FRB94_007498 [Tulasnella sp. JGI-2019a]
MPYFPRFNYPITRDIRWRLEPFAYVLAVIAIGILIPLNYALTGYETITQPNLDYNYAPYHWYNRFVPPPKPGSSCDAYKFSVGDSFVIGPGIFTYQLASILGTGDGAGDGTNVLSSISYKGQTLEYCDVGYMSVSIDARLQVSTIVARVACTDQTLFPVLFTTSFQSTPLGPSSTFEAKENSRIGNLTLYNALRNDVSYLVSDAGLDLVSQMTDVIDNNTTSIMAPSFLSVSTSMASLLEEYPPWWCPPTTSKTNVTCATATPSILDALDPFLVYGVNGNAVGPLTGDYSLAINNAMQTMLAAVRIDLGNVLPNNFLVNRSSELIAKTIAPSMPAPGATKATNTTSVLYGDLTAARDSSNYSPVKVGNNGSGTVAPSQISVEYQCRVEQRKSPGSIFISVAVATMTLFKSGWAVLLLVLTFLARRGEPEGGKSCVGHEALEARIRDLERAQLSTPNLDKEE